LGVVELWSCGVVVEAQGKKVPVNPHESDAEEALSLLDAAARGAMEPEAWRSAFGALLRRHPNAVRAGYIWGDLIVRAAATSPRYVIETLMRHGAAANVNADPGGAPDQAREFKPLHNAAYHGNADAADVLLAYGADPMARDETFKRTPAEWAEAGGHHGLSERLRAAARDILERRQQARTTQDPIALFLYSACWDHHVHGAGDHRMYDRAAQRILAGDPGIATHDLYTAVVCGELDEVRRLLAERPDAARERGGARDWTPLLYLCYTRFTHPPTLANAEAVARLLLDHGADPNDFYMAGDSQYTALVGAAGEGEQDSPRQPWSAAVYGLLLDRGAGPYDIQVLYNTHFSADMLWWLELTYDHCVARGRKADWDDPAWRMLDMGGYGPGAYFVLDRAMRKNNLAVMEWALAHGADPNIMSSDHRKFHPKRSLYEAAMLHGRPEAAALLQRHGGRALGPRELAPWETFVDACVRLDRGTAAALLERHPELKSGPEPLFEAARLDRADVLAMLADLGYALDAADAHNTRALHHAAVANALNAARFLVERRVDVDARETRWDAAPIGWASHADRTEMIEFLSRYTRRIWTLIFRGYVDRVRELLRESPELAREVTPEGMTPLWWLPDDEDKATELVSLLIAAGADPAAKCADGGTAADWARRRGMFAIARRLDEAAASAR